MSSDEEFLRENSEYCKPFKHNKFKNKSQWNPTGPRAVEDFISLTSKAINESKFFAPTEQNITKEERAAITALSKNNSIVIKPADKGGAIVILNREDYVKEGLRQLTDSKVYRRLELDKSVEFLSIIREFLQYSVREGEIDKEVCDYLSNFIPRTSRLYFLPKIHKKKTPPPGRPVVSCNGSPTERISEFVDFFLKPFVQKTKSYIKDSTDFLRKLESFRVLPEKAILFTMDVVSLYTNIPTDLGIKTMEEFLETDLTMKNQVTNFY